MGQITYDARLDDAEMPSVLAQFVELLASFFDISPF